MGEAVGGLLPSAVGVALSPVPIVAVILMLGTPRARSNGPAFAVGWIAALVVVSAVVLMLSSAADDPDSGASTAVGWIKISLGAVFLAMAARQWRARSQPGSEAELPGWMAAIDSFTAGRSLGLGALLAGVNPKNLALSFAAASTISLAGLSPGGDVVAVGLFVVIASLTVAGPVVLFLLAPATAGPWLSSLKDLLAANNTVIMMVVLLVLGAKLVGDGIRIVVP